MKKPIKDVNDYTNSYNTELTPEAELLFNNWAGDRKSDMYDYDLKGYFNQFPNEPLVKGTHLIDTYKKPNHITFSNQSKYASDSIPGGKWEDLGRGKFNFIPASHTVERYGPNILKNYFVEHEKSSNLILPKLILK